MAGSGKAQTQALAYGYGRVPALHARFRPGVGLLALCFSVLMRTRQIRPHLEKVRDSCA